MSFIYREEHFHIFNCLYLACHSFIEIIVLSNHPIDYVAMCARSPIWVYDQTQHSYGPDKGVGHMGVGCKTISFAQEAQS